jgi:hypothetical protein
MGGLADLVSATGAQTWMHTADAPVIEGAAFCPVMPGYAACCSTASRVCCRVTSPPGHIVLLWPDRRVLFAAHSCMNLLGLRQRLLKTPHSVRKACGASQCWISRLRALGSANRS